LEINTILGPAAIQLGAQTQRDNLDKLAALLTTRSHRQNATATLPVGALFPGKEGPSPFLPQIVYTLQRAEQKGSVNLETGEFTETFVPNQVSTTHAATVDWTVGVFRLGYRLTVGVIDNRQDERAAADSNVTGHAIQAGANPLPTMQLAAEVGTERQRNDDPFTVLTTNRVAAQATWGFTTLTTLAANLNLTDGEDDTGQTRNTALAADASLTFRLSKTTKDQKHGVSAQAFLRYGFTESKSRSPFSPDEVVRKQWILSSGLTLSLF
ncbi:MAG: hypothetical protein JNK60_14405, partial [Acidobacteria bacterium]|nr:hypothetical protein [Acidobacteriota bacterium]